jgi:hypothetical protein
MPMEQMQMPREFLSAPVSVSSVSVSGSVRGLVVQSRVVRSQGRLASTHTHTHANRPQSAAAARGASHPPLAGRLEQLNQSPASEFSVFSANHQFCLRAIAQPFA